MKSSWMLIAALLFAVLGTCVKLGSEYFSALELVFYRSLFGVIIIGLLVRRQGGSLKTVHVRMHLSRGLVGLGSLAFYFYALVALPVATAVTLNYTSSMFLTLITLLWYREPVRLHLVLAVALGFLGVILLLKPTLDESQLAAGLLGLVSGFLAAIAYLNIKQLSALGEPDERVVFYFSFVSTVISGVILCFHEFHTINVRSGALLLGIGAAATFGQLTMTRAYRVGKTLVVSALAYSAVVFSALIGFFLFHESLSASSWVGITIIIAAGLFAVHASTATSD